MIFKLLFQELLIEKLCLIGVMVYYFMPSILLEHTVYIKAHITYVFVFPQQYNKFTPHAIVMGERRLHSMHFDAFPKRIASKRANNQEIHQSVADEPVGLGKQLVEHEDLRKFTIQLQTNWLRDRTG